jgi:putative DNA primase/helicase
MTDAQPLNDHDWRRQVAAVGLVVPEVPPLDLPNPVEVRVQGAPGVTGWLSLYLAPLPGGGTVVAGSFGIFTGTEVGATALKLPPEAVEQLTGQQLDAIKARHQADKRAAKAMLARIHRRSEEEASRAWAGCAAEGHSELLKLHGLPPGKLYGARLSPEGGLVVLLVDARNRPCSLYRPRDPAGPGEWRRWPASPVRPGFHMIGSPQRGSVVLLCVDFLTAAVLHEATRLPTALCGDLAALLPVAVDLAEVHKAQVVIASAADVASTHAAQAAAMAVGGHWLAPAPPEGSDAAPAPATFAELHRHPQGGAALLARQVEALAHRQGLRLQPCQAAPAAPRQGPGGGRPRALSVMQLDDLVRRFIPVTDGTGGIVFDTWTLGLVSIKQMLALAEPGVRMDDIKAHPVWIDRGAYYIDEVGFDPSERDPEVQLNTWKGWPMRPAPGRCDRLLDLLRYLCGEDNGDEVHWWLLRWVAYPLQNPGAKLPSAVIMHGPQGTGKSTFWQCLVRIYGQYATVLNQRGLEDKFNADWVDAKLFLLAEEVVNRQEMWHIKNELKELTTGEWVRVNGKHVGAYRQRNHINMVFLSNEGQPLPLDNDDRRHLVVWTPPQREAAFYDAVQDEIAAGGVQALYQYLLDLPMEGWLPHRRPPMTDAKRELANVSASSEERFVREWVDRDLQLPVGPVLSVDLYRAYVRWCERSGERRSMRTREQFLNTVGRMRGWEKRHARVAIGAGTARPMRVVIPPDEVLQQCGTAQPPEQSSPEWLGRWCEAFADALRSGQEGQPWAA